MEAIRVLEVVYASAVTDTTRPTNQFTGLVLTAPEAVRAKVAGLTTRQQLDRARRFADRADHDLLVRQVRYALGELARRIAALHAQQADLD